jgi:PAS domain S-box-containing protein
VARPSTTMEQFALLDSAPDAILVVNERGQIIFANSQVEQLFGYSRHELLGASIEQPIPDSQRAAHVRHRLAYMVAPSCRAMGTGLDLRARHRDGHEFPVDISISAIQTDDGTRVSGACARGLWPDQGLVAAESDTRRVTSLLGIPEIGTSRRHRAAAGGASIGHKLVKHASDTCIVCDHLGKRPLQYLLEGKPIGVGQSGILLQAFFDSCDSAQLRLELGAQVHQARDHGSERIGTSHTTRSVKSICTSMRRSSTLMSWTAVWFPVSWPPSSRRVPYNAAHYASLHATPVRSRGSRS